MGIAVRKTDQEKLYMCTEWKELLHMHVLISGGYVEYGNLGSPAVSHHSLNDKAIESAL